MPMAEVNATIKCYLALKLAGVSVTDRRILRARELALSLGGVPRMNTFSKLYLALLGLFPWEYVPTIPCEVILIGKWFYVNFNEMSSWSRSMLVPLAIINHYRPTRPLKNNTNLNELYPEGVHERDLAPVPDPNAAQPLEKSRTPSGARGFCRRHVPGARRQSGAR